MRRQRDRLRYQDGGHLRIGSSAQRGRAGRQGAGEIVGDAQHVAGEFRHRILRGFLVFLVGAAADIFHFRQGAQALVLEAFDFGLQGFQHSEFRRMGIVVARERAGRNLGILFVAHGVFLKL